MEGRRFEGLGAGKRGVGGCVLVGGGWEVEGGGECDARGDSLLFAPPRLCQAPPSLPSPPLPSAPLAGTHAHLVLDLGHRALGPPVHLRRQRGRVQLAVGEPRDAGALAGGAAEAGATEAVPLQVLFMAQVRQGVEAHLRDGIPRRGVWPRGRGPAAWRIRGGGARGYPPPPRRARVWWAPPPRPARCAPSGWCGARYNQGRNPGWTSSWRSAAPWPVEGGIARG